MNYLKDELSDIVGEVFKKLYKNKEYGKTTYSNRPDLCDFQCNGALVCAKALKKNPLSIATEVSEELKNNKYFKKIEAIAPGFINITVSDEFLISRINSMNKDKDLFIEKKSSEKIIVDYGGPNVAKPLHVGHLRSAVIGEAIKRICKKKGNYVIGDIHMGDFGLQMGLIIAEYRYRNPNSIYFKEGVEEFPSTSPFTISELEEIYPTASKKSKEDEDFYNKAMEETLRLQKGEKSHVALWEHIMNVSKADLKINYDKLDVHFEEWNGESDADPYIKNMVEKLKKEGHAYISDGALVVDVSMESDKKEIPPCMILKSNGASLYNTTDLATLVMRKEKHNPDKVIYVVDKRQDMYFTQIFRCAKKTGIVDEKTNLLFKGFGTVNGKDGKPFKTRDGGTMRLESLLNEIEEIMVDRFRENAELSEEEKLENGKRVALATIKYGDLFNQPSKDYVFDMEKFSSFEGNTGPYILYTIVRLKSLLIKQKIDYTNVIKNPLDKNLISGVFSESDKKLMLKLLSYNVAFDDAYNELSPHKLCNYMYELCNDINRFYHENNVSLEKDEKKKNSWIGECILSLKVLEDCIDSLGFKSVDKM